jgi:hypothetical protein
MGFITIGYAVQPLSPHPLSFLSRLRPANLFSDEANKSASRIVELAKQAIYQEISAPCDITSADKALILIAGPSHELSMKGFMTVRKWIDRSIAGLETRSGDYPVTNTKYVAIIIMLSGLENIPRLTELKEIREQYKAGVLKATTEELKSRKETLTGLNISDTGRMPEDISVLPIDLEKKDEMIVLPIKKANSGSGGRSSLQKPAMQPGHLDEGRQHSGGDISGISPAPAGKAGKSPAGEMNEKAVTPISAVSPVSPSDIATRREPGAHRPSRTVIPAASGSGSNGDEQIARGASREATGRSALKMSDHMNSRELDRKRIERELQRQRMVAIGGRREQQQEPATEPSRPPSHVAEEHKTIIRRISRTKPESMAPGPDDVTAKPAQPPPPDEKTIIRIKKRAPLNEGGMAQKRETLPDNGSGNGLDLVNRPAEYLAVATPDEEKIGLKDRRPQTRDEDILKGKLVLKKDISHIKDDALLHTDLKSRKSPVANETSTERSYRVTNGADTARPRKKEDRPAPDDKDELSWI